MRVTFAYPFTASDGTNYLADESADLQRDFASSLIHSGLARKASAPAPVAPPQDFLIPEVPEEDSDPTEQESQDG